MLRNKRGWMERIMPRHPFGLTFWRYESGMFSYIHTDKISAKRRRMGTVIDFREKTSPLIIKDVYEGGETYTCLRYDVIPPRSRK
jgi:hypothetical protein